MLTGWELQRRFRPQVVLLEDRNAPGSLLGDLLADVFAAALMPPVGGRDARPHDDDPRREVLRFSLPEGEPPAPSAPVVLRGGDDMGTAGGGVVSVRDGDETAFFWLPDTSAGSPLQLGDPIPVALPHDAAGTDSPASTGNGVGTRVPASAFDAPPLGSTHDHFAASAHAPRDSVSDEFDGSFRVTNEIEPDPDEPPNNAPIAVDDTAALAEDTFVTIDVTANDSDADSDALRVDGWDAEPEHGTLQMNEDGTLTYTPFRDFAGTDTFTVNVTDGRDTDTASVTMTVMPVNDAPLAFHDGFSFRNDVADGDPSWPAEEPYPYVPVLSGSILSNDYDVDDAALTIADLDFSSTVGTVTVDAGGGVSWVGPWDFAGMTSFQYRTMDAGGALSDWATARLWSFTPEPPLPPGSGGGEGGGGGWGSLDGPPLPIDPIPRSWPPAMPQDDLIPVGDTEGSDGVMGNDTNAIAAVVVSHPSSTRLTSFGFDGTFNFRPGMPRMDDGFTYRLFGPGGATFMLAQAKMPVVNLEVFHGQNGDALREGFGANDEEFVRGAFTVANRNDTDSDGIIDNIDNAGVHAGDGKAGGENEKDLMMLIVHKPTGMGNNDKLTVTISSGQARLYGHHLREGASFTSKTLTGANFGDGLAAVYHLEAFETSAKMRDIEVQMKYGNATDSVRATGIWVSSNNPYDFFNSGTTPHPDGKDTPYVNAFAKHVTSVAGGKLGESPIYFTSYLYQPPYQPQSQAYTKYEVHIANHIYVLFTTAPAGLHTEPIVRFDTTRSAHAGVWTQAAGGKPVLFMGIAPQENRDLANDDRSDAGEDNTPLNDHIMAFDNPGLHREIGGTAATNKNFSIPNVQRVIHRMNAWEFVRIKVDGKNFVHNDLNENGAKMKANEDPGNIQGSRASLAYPWRSRLELTWDAQNNVWVRVPNTDPSHPVNYIGPEHDNLEAGI